MVLRPVAPRRASGATLHLTAPQIKLSEETISIAWDAIGQDTCVNHVTSGLTQISTIVENGKGARRIGNYERGR